jgi:hypothetical protein
MADLETILKYITLISVPIGVFYHIMTLSNTRKNQKMTLETRQAQLFMYMYDRWSDPEFMKHWYIIEKWEWTDYDDFIQKYKSDEDVYVHFGTVARFYEGVGVLVDKELVDPILVDDLVSGHLISFWGKFGESYIKERQVHDNYPQYGEFIEKLYHEIKNITESQHPELAS